MLTHWIVWLTGGGLFFLFLFASIEFLLERERYALRKSLLLMLLAPLPFILAGILNIHSIEIMLSILTLTILLVIIIPFKTPTGIIDMEPEGKYDERDTMFSRRELAPESERYKDYYQRNPEKESADMNFRKEPGLLASNSLYFNRKAFADAEASFAAVKLLHKRVDGNPARQRKVISSEEFSETLIKWMKELGALDVGFASLKPYHFYSVKGRGDSYGHIIESDDKFAIAFTVEMKREMVKPAPKASIVLESARQYLNSGNIAVQVAEHIRSMGYNARAHIDGNYQVVCPLVARDAGLGEIGRMGLLMTPKQGPRVRIAVVTTDLKLNTHSYTPDTSILDFCMKCKKCASCCPAKSIELSKPQINQDVKRWKINSVSCYTYWCKAGTDCGRCMAICPYSHPDKGLHKLIRWGIKKSRSFRTLAVWLDDFFYGKLPKPHPLPKWLNE